MARLRRDLELPPGVLDDEMRETLDRAIERRTRLSVNAPPRAQIEHGAIAAYASWPGGAQWHAYLKSNAREPT